MFDRRIKSKEREYCRALLVDGADAVFGARPRNGSSDAGAITTCARLIHALEKPNLHRLPRSRLSSPSSNN
jgi:hypothetical protein